MQFAMKYDIMDWFYPMRYFIGECLQEGVLPNWNPYINLGYPIHTDPQSGALYPIVWVLAYCFGYSVYTLQFEFILHILLGFWGMQKLARAIAIDRDTALLVGITYACCGFFIGNAQHLSWIISASWVPFVLAYYIRLLRFNQWKDALWLALCAHLLLVGGYPAFSIILFYGLGLFFLIYLIRHLRKKRYSFLKSLLVNHILFGLTLLILSAAFLYHFVEALPLMVRAERLSLEEIQLLPFSPTSFFTLLAPAITGGRSAFLGTDPSMANAYFGLIPLVFFLGAIRLKANRKVLLLLGVGILCLLIAMGEHFFLRAALYHYVPLMDIFRYPALFRLFALIPFLLLFGMTFQRFTGRPKGVPAPANTKKYLLGINLILLLAISGLYLYAGFKSDLSFAELQLGSTSGWLPSATNISNFINQNNNSQMVLLQAPVQLLILGLSLWFIYRHKGQKLKRLLTFLILFDLFIASQICLPITVISDARTKTIQEKINEQPEGFPIPKKNISEVIHQGGKRFYPIWFNQNMLTKEIAHNGYNNLKFKAYRDFKNTEGHMEKLNHPLLYLSERSSNEDTIIIQKFTPNNIEATVQLTAPTEIRMLQYAYPGWEVHQGDVTIPTYIKEKIFLAFKLPPGEHKVHITFRPPNYLSLLLLSFGGILLLVLAGSVRNYNSTSGRS